MENDAGVCELVELIFDKKITIVEKMVPRCSRIPKCLQSKDFLNRLNKCLVFKKEFLYCKWNQYLDAYIRKMLSSHEMYLMYIMVACLFEIEFYKDVFDSFISVCCIVKFFSQETLEKTGVNLSEMNPDILMVFYDRVLKNNFCKHGGFHRLVEYIHSNKHIAWDLHKDRDSSDNSADPLMDIAVKFGLGLQGFDFQKVTNSIDGEKGASGKSLAEKVLSTTSVQLPTLPSEPDLIKKLVASRKKEIAEKKKIDPTGRYWWLKEVTHSLSKETGKIESKINLYISKIKCEKKKIVKNAAKKITEATGKPEGFKLAVPGCSSLNSDSEINYDAKQQKNSEQYENIIQAVIRHNQSKSSGHESANNRIREKADGILEDLNGTIKSLLEVLNE